MACNVIPSSLQSKFASLTSSLIAVRLDELKCSSMFFSGTDRQGAFSKFRLLQVWLQAWCLRVLEEVRARARKGFYNKTRDCHASNSQLERSLNSRCVTSLADFYFLSFCIFVPLLVFVRSYISAALHYHPIHVLVTGTSPFYLICTQEHHDNTIQSSHEQ